MPPPSRGYATARRIDRYVLRQLLVALVAVSGALVALIWLTQSLRFVELVVNRGLSFRVFFQLTSLLIPNFVAVILPITTFVVVQFVYQRLAGDRELTVLRAAGLSPLALARPALGLQEGVFTPVSDDMTVYVRKRDPDGTLHGIIVDDARDKNSRATILAERGQLVGVGGVPSVELFNGSREQIDRRSGRLNVLTFAENTIDLSPSGKNEEVRLRDPTEMSIQELLNPAPGVVADRDLPKLAVEANRRLASPFTAFSFAMVALVAVLMGTFRRHGNVLRPLVAVLAVVGLLALGLAVANLATRDPTLLPLIWVHALAPGLFAAWLLIGPQLHLVPQSLLVRIGAV
jgi:lipopolysaccharide export system permease protein